MTTPASQGVTSSPRNLFSILSHNETLEMFAMAKDGLKISPSIIDKLDISPKAYYRALKQLKDAGLVEKKKDEVGMIRYFHTTFGSIVYQRNIVEMTQHMHSLEKMQMIDTLKSAEKYPEADILKLIKVNIPSAISESTNDNIDIIMSFDKAIQKLLKWIECCKSEILISTRICPEIVINKLLEKSKLGVKVKIIADIKLVKEYFRSQEKYVHNLNKEKSLEERKCVIANPWYPNNTVNRRIADIPFGMIILDGREVGIELVSSNNPKEFCGGIFIRDEKIAKAMTEFYQRMWEKAAENVDVPSDAMI
jgi:predicted transcriptional regulator